MDSSSRSSIYHIVVGAAFTQQRLHQQNRIVFEQVGQWRALSSWSLRLLANIVVVMRFQDSQRGAGAMSFDYDSAQTVNSISHPYCSRLEDL
jgi:hypothetical protein